MADPRNGGPESNKQQCMAVWSSKAARKEVWGGGKTTGSLGDGSPPAGSRDGAPVGGLEDEVPQELNNF